MSPAIKNRLFSKSNGWFVTWLPTTKTSLLAPKTALDHKGVILDVVPRFHSTDETPKDFIKFQIGVLEWFYESV